MFKELRILDGLIQNATITYDDETFTYADVCAKWLGDCFENDILNLDYVMDDVSDRGVISFFFLCLIYAKWRLYSYLLYI